MLYFKAIHKPKGNTVQKTLPDASPPAGKNLWRIIEVARLSRTSLYLVGGSIRDKVIGLPLTELDLVTLVNPHHFVVKLEAKLNAKVLNKSPYGTYKLTVGETLVDICMSRTERYSKPAGKPLISPASIIMDMHRRDFSVNAIALPLFPRKPATLIDPTDGLADINNRSIRILHHNSFIDDPTRIIRAIRYEQRLGFTIEPTTFKLLLKDKEHLRLLPTTKVRKILEEIFAEEHVEQVINRILQLNLLPFLNDLLLCFNKYHFPIQSIVNIKPRVKYLDISLGISSWLLTRTQLARLKRQLACTNQQMKLVDQILSIRDLFKKIGNSNPCLSDICFKLKQTSELSRIIATHAISDKYCINLLKEYESKLKWIRPTLSNRDICAKTGISEGPLLGQVIRAIIVAKIDGIVSGKTEELQLARSVIRAS